MIQEVSIGTVKCRKPFNDIFPIEDRTLGKIKSHMKKHGFDPTQPVVVWRREKVVIDGNTRMKAAEESGLDMIHVAFKDFPNEREAIKYAIHNQRDRRNWTDAQILAALEKIDKRKKRGGDRKSKKAKSKGPAKPIDSATETAKVLNISRTKVKKARIVRDHGDQETKKAVREGQKSINKAAEEIQQRRKSKAKVTGLDKRLLAILKYLRAAQNKIVLVNSCLRDMDAVAMEGVMAGFAGFDLARFAREFSEFYEYFRKPKREPTNVGSHEKQIEQKAIEVEFKPVEEPAATKVVNVKTDSYDVYIGRVPKYGSTKWGNPWGMKKDGLTRKECVENYEAWLRDNNVNGNKKATVKARARILKHLVELKGKALGCHCKPDACHGDVLVKLIKEQEEAGAAPRQGIVEVDDSNFESMVLKATKPVLVDFWAASCGPCKAVAPVVEKLEQKYGDRMIFAKCDVGKSPDIPTQYEIKHIPAFILFEYGTVTDTVVGQVPRSHLEGFIKKVL
jgi:thioredoxin 1